MSNIKITRKDGRVHNYLHEGRPGGSYTKTLKLENGFAIVQDEYGERFIIPSFDIDEIVETPHRW